MSVVAFGAVLLLGVALYGMAGASCWIVAARIMVKHPTASNLLGSAGTLMLIVALSLGVIFCGCLWR